MDALAGLLDGPRGRGAFLLRSVLEPPWSVCLDDGAPLGLVAVLRGTAWLGPGGGEARQLRPGAIAVVKGDDPVVLSSSPGLAPQVVFGSAGRQTSPAGADLSESLRLGPRTWGNDPDGSTLILLGCYQLRGDVSRRVLEALPRQVVLEPETWSSPLVPLLGDEITADEPGQQAVLDRLFDLLLVSVVRAWFGRPEADVPSWYGAHRDPVVGTALRLLHADLARPWTVASLAAETGVSRSTLARCFTDRVGTAPMAYLKEWRLARAADLMLDPDHTLDAIARRVGYSDGPTLSSIFKGARGVSPRQYREAAADECGHRPRSDSP